MERQGGTGRNRLLSGRDLKWIACLCMLADHAAKAFSLSGAAFFVLSDLIGRVTFPIFCMLLAEGFIHTHSRLLYMRNVLVLALISEIPFDLMFSRTPFDRTSQNTCFTLLLGLLLFALLDRVRTKPDLDFRTAALLQIISAVLFAVCASLLHTDYGAGGIAALAVFYYSSAERQKTNRGTSAAAACLCLNLCHFHNAGAFLALIPLSLYSGQRGMRSAAGKYAFYLFYPAHLILLTLLRMFLF